MLSLILKTSYRFLKSKRYGALAHFMSMASTFGIAVGVCALIVGLSAMRGFEFELHNRVLSLIPTAQLKAFNGFFYDIHSDIKFLEENEFIEAAAPAKEIEGVFVSGRDFAPAAIIGIDVRREPEVIELDRFMDCSIDELESDTDELKIIIGTGIAKRLHVNKGDTIDLITAEESTAADTNFLSQPVSATFKIVGTFKTGGVIDSSMAFIDVDDAVNITFTPSPDTIHIRTKDLTAAFDEVYNATKNFPEEVAIQSWMQSQGKLYNDIQMVRGIMYIAMFLVLTVACFNIISNLIMTVSEKSHEIAIMLTMGASRSFIIKVFTCLGMMSALRGAIIGLVLGCGIAMALTPITKNFEEWFGFKLLDENIYFVNFIPVKLDIEDIAIVMSCAVIMAFLASIYPAIKASRIKPAEELSM